MENVCEIKNDPETVLKSHKPQLFVLSGVGAVLRPPCLLCSAGPARRSPALNPILDRQIGFSLKFAVFFYRHGILGSVCLTCDLLSFGNKRAKSG